MRRRDRGEGHVFKQPESRYWWIQYWHHGKRYRESSKSTRKKDAQALLRARLGVLDTGKLPGIKAEKVTFADLKALVRGDYKRNGNDSLARVDLAFTHLDTVFQHYRALAISEPMIERYLQTREDAGASPATMNYELAMLRRGFRLALKTKLLTSMPTIPRFKVQNAREGFFERRELNALLAELPYYHRGWNRFAYLTGWRVKSEVLTRQWHHVDLHTGFIRLEPSETKNDKGREFPFHNLPELKAVLEQQRAYTDHIERTMDVIVPWVFHRDGHQIKNFRAAWRSACQRAKLVGKIPHDYRRTAVRNLDDAGVSRKRAKELVGHETDEIYDRYSIVNKQDLSDSTAKLARLSPDTSITPISQTGTQ